MKERLGSRKEEGEGNKKMKDRRGRRREKD